MHDRVGFIGLGRMGSAMAANLARAGYELVVHNRTRAVADVFAADHAALVAESPRALAQRSDIVITMLADDVALRDVMHGPDGVLIGLRPGSLVVDMGTSGRREVIALGDAVTAQGSDMLDAPVSGVPKVAAEGRLTLMVGGPSAALERARPVLEALSQRVIHVGALGTGAAMKLAINTAIHGLNLSLSEALVLAERSGIDRATAYEVFASGAISGPFVVNRRQVFEHPGVGPQPFALRLAVKDVRLALELADDVGVSLEQAGLNMAVFQRAADAGYADLDESAVAIYLRGGLDPVDTAAT